MSPVFDGVTRCQNCDSPPFPVPGSPFPIRCQFASGATSSDVFSGQNTGGEDVPDIPIQPSEWIRSRSTTFVPTRNAQFVKAT